MATKKLGWIIGIAVCAITIVVLLLTGNLSFLDSQYFTKAGKLRALWHDSRYEELITATEEILEDNPMDRIALLYGGFAHFYSGINNSIKEEKDLHIHHAITLLKKADLYRNFGVRGQLYYVLAKAYFYHNPQYYTFTAEYMLDSIDTGYINSDSYEHLGLTYRYLGDRAQSIEWLERAMEKFPSPLVTIMLARTYAEDEKYVRALEYVKPILAESEDEFIILQANYVLARIMIGQGRFLEADRIVQDIIQADSESAEAHYLVGKINYDTGNNEKARFEWREALRFDPGYQEALESLQEL